MAIRVSSIRRLTGNPKATMPNAPRNYGRGEGAQAQLDHRVSAINRQFVESLNVDGIPATFWHRGAAGNFCTCHDPQSARDLRDAQAGNQSDANENADDQHRDDAESRSTDEFTIRNARDIREGSENVTRDVFGVRMGELPVEEDIGTEDNYDYNEDNTADDAWLRDPQGDALLRMGPDSGILFGGERTQCGICFGTGHVSGYQLHAGVREIFDASGTHQLYMQGFSLNTEDHPHSFEGPPDPESSVEFDYELPHYFQRCLMVALRNNTVGARGFVVECREQTGTQWYSFNQDFIDRAKGQMRFLRIRVRPTEWRPDGTLKFTHLEVVLQFAEWPKVQMPPLGESTNFGVFDSLQTTDITLPPSIAEAGKEDVIWEGKYGKLWKVTEMTDFQTARRQVLGWTAQCRVVQEYEQISLLRLCRQPYFNLPFGRMESRQGSRLSADDDF